MEIKMIPCWKNRFCHLVNLGSYIFFLGGLFMNCCIGDSAFAQSRIVPDRTLGDDNSRVVNNYQNNSTELLTGGAVRGNNLFHSFLELNVSEGRRAFFLSPSSNIQNIITRVTGGNRSEILGVLGTFQMINGKNAASGANLFLINPNGIIFGPNAVLNLGGSFIGSTASGIKFADGSFLSTNAPQTTPLLTVSVPVGLQFKQNAANINIQGAIGVSPGKTLALVGGNVTLDGGFLSATSGQIALGGTLASGIVGLNLDNNNQPLSFPNDVLPADILLRNAAVVDASGEGGGNIQIFGNRVGLRERSLIFADTLGSQNSRGISVQAEELSIKDGSQISASTVSEGAGGSLTVRASDSVEVEGTDADGNPSALLTDTFGSGTGGNLTVETGRLTVENGANLTSITGSQGRGGTLTVRASDFVKLSGTSGVSGLPSGLFAQTLGTGDAGSLNINTRQLIVKNGAQVTSGTGTDSQGKGGTLVVQASDGVELSGTAPNGKDTSGLFARSRGKGDAGSLKITTGQLQIQDRAQVTVSSLASGNAGNLEITANNIFLDDQAKIIAETKSGNGGDIVLRIADLLLLRRGSQISTTAGTANAGGDGGNITIDTPEGFIVAVPSENSDITANAYTGKGGSVQINAFGIFGTEFRNQPTPLSDITASSQFGLNGTVQIKTPEIDPNQGLVNLPKEPGEAKLAQSCRASNGNHQSQFIITGHGGLPASPTNTIVAESAIANWITVQPESKIYPRTRAVIATKASPKPAPEKIVEATRWILNSQGELILTANAVSIASHHSGQTACS
jgi:filamentous hemagglutinin family protein